MKTTNKKLQLKKETMAVLNDKSLFAIIGGNPIDGDSIILNSVYINQCHPSETCPTTSIEPSDFCLSIQNCETEVGCETGASPCKNYTKQVC